MGAHDTRIPIYGRKCLDENTLRKNNGNNNWDGEKQLAFKFRVQGRHEYNGTNNFVFA